MANLIPRTIRMANKTPETAVKALAKIMVKDELAQKLKLGLRYEKPKKMRERLAVWTPFPCGCCCLLLLLHSHISERDFAAGVQARNGEEGSGARRVQVNVFSSCSYLPFTHH